MSGRKKSKRRFRMGIGILVTAVLLCVGLYYAGRAVAREVYPLRYSEEVMAAAAEYELSPALIYAVIRTESGFREKAVSPAGAAGLMQLTEAAFKEAQKKRDGRVSLDAQQRLDPAVNIQYGSCYLALMLRRFSCEETALAAYNAGPNRVTGWLKDAACSEDGVTLTYIPYEETQNYVKRIEQARNFYRFLYGLT